MTEPAPSPNSPLPAQMQAMIADFQSDNGPTMLAWDAWRAYIAKGGGASWPRDAFEALLDGVTQVLEDAVNSHATLTAERDEARSRLADIAANGLSNCCIADVTEPCGPFIEMQLERDAALAEVAALRAALEPFAVAAERLEKFRDDRPLWAALDTAFAHRADILLTVGQLRRARAALAPKGAPDV